MLVLSDDVENESVPYVNITLIVANFAVLALMFFGGFSGEIYHSSGFIPSRFLAHPDIEQLGSIVSSMFIHSGWLHLVGNLWALYLFGDNVEDRLGHMTYLVFYLACGMFAGFIQILSDPTSTIPVVGASGAIAGVMGAYLALHPEARCKTWFGGDCFFLAFKTYKIPALFVIGGWFLLQVLFAGIVPSGVGGIAFFSHIGGFLSGVALLPILRYREYKNSVTNVTPLSLVSLICLGLMIWHFASIPPAPAAAKAAIPAAPTQTTQSTAKPIDNTSTSTSKVKIYASKHHSSHHNHRHK